MTLSDLVEQFIEAALLRASPPPDAQRRFPDAWAIRRRSIEETLRKVYGAEMVTLALRMGTEIRKDGAVVGTLSDHALMGSDNDLARALKPIIAALEADKGNR